MKQNTQTQTKISDSKTWIFCLKHFNKQNCGHTQAQHNQQKHDQLQYVIAATFDQWLSIKIINSTKMNWLKFIELKVTMPIVNAFIQFGEEFKPSNIVFAYFDGSIQCCPWEKISRFYSNEIQGARKRELTKTFTQVLKQVKRPVYINQIYDESQRIEEVFMLETVCFLHKKGQYLYAINLKGQLKIFKVQEAQRKIELVQKFRFSMKVSLAQYIPRYELKDSLSTSFLVAICFEKISIPFVLQISYKLTFEEIKLKIQKIYQEISKLQIESKENIKYLTFDSKLQTLVGCSQKNQISIFSLEKQEFMQKDCVFVLQLEKKFFLESSKSVIQNINDLSVKDSRLLILCNQSFFIYDLAEGMILNEGEKLKQTLDIGKLVSAQPQKGKPVLLIKKKFNYLDPKQRSSTTLHLFTGK